MPGVKTLRDFVNQRLTAAAEEIFGVFERTIAEYEEQLCRCKEENERKQKLLDDVQLCFRRADNQQLSVTQEEVPSEQQEWSSSLDQEDTEPPHLKEEEEELWSSQERLEEFNTIKFPFAPVPVKTEDDEEKPQSSQLHEIQREGMKTGADGEDCGGPEQVRNSEPERHLHEDKTEDFSESDTDYSDDWRDTMENDSGLNCVENFDDDRSDSDKKSHSCSQCSRTFTRKCHLATHMRRHQKEKPSSCSDCGKRFKLKSSLAKHMVIHTGEKPFSCPECDKKFSKLSQLKSHMFVHTGEKPFSCSKCDKKFNHKCNLTKHMVSHTGEQSFSCSQCDKKFHEKAQLNAHMFVHTGEKPFNCSQCKKGFNYKSHLNRHMLVHTGEKPFSCPWCDKKFNQNSNLTSHMVIHTGEKPSAVSSVIRNFHGIVRISQYNCVKMPGVETLRDFVNQRLTAAAEEIFGVFERTIAEYEEQLCRCKEENERKQKLLDDVQLRLYRADNQQLSVHQEEVPSEQQEWSSSLDQENTEPPHTKEEVEELWSSQEGLDGIYTIKFPFAPVPVKTEDDEEKPQSSQLHEIQSEGKTGADGEECGGPEQTWNSEPETLLHSETQDKTGDCSESETDGSEDWRVTLENDSGLNCVENFDDDRSDNDKKSHSCSQCSKTFIRKCHLVTHMRIHQKKKPLSCPDCGKRFKHKAHLNSHMFLHAGERPFSSSKYDKTFNKKSTLTNHMLTYGQGNFSCPRCDKKFNHKSHLNSHMLMHTGEKPFSCHQCDKKFNQKSNLNKHMVIHTGEKPFSCPQCDKKFSQKSNLNKHMVIHTGEKPFSCPQCDKKFSHKSYLTSHMVIHTGEKPFSCELCDQKFSWLTQVKNHKCSGGQTS
ncbi:zinc finger protein 320-like [Cheilinus undulatus]|uniref:zinc finger protein 320-like n=1 Tax=Cheilinus undulatus TaxID=241271 RepID=UPI001BD6D6BB|nr:zinc finger protein 320-like [Cheilinus undulatus]